MKRSILWGRDREEERSVLREALLRPSHDPDSCKTLEAGYKTQIDESNITSSTPEYPIVGEAKMRR